MSAYNIVGSPVGRLLVGVDEKDRVVRLWFWKDGEDFREIGWVRDPARTKEAERQLTEYFSGERRSFDLEVAPQGTPFQRRVWAKLREIPYGETRTYGELAASLGNPDACRAVGAANGANPIPILIPCHRVIGRDGSMTGFGGGVDVKRRLLALEQGQLRTLFD
ncbi:MAG: methylated-DNA--[protein]-cysteine S-methyltransferase [Fimbriimonadaceae bacterium]|nr:methylated-DNA--[protein]-cysteine S-methyltransferase [Fimbriimonadaceae bacterium]